MTRAYTMRILGLACLSVLVFVFIGLRAEPVGAADASTSSDSSSIGLSPQDAEGSSSSTTSEDEENKKKSKTSAKASKARAKKKSSEEKSSETETVPLAQPKQEVRTVMPPAPTAAPSAFGQGASATTPPTEFGPIPPTGFGGYEGALPAGPRTTGKGQTSGAGAAGTAPSPFGPFVTPPTPTPSASEGAAAADPTLGRYSSYAVPQATGQLGLDQRPAPSQPAVMKKPFADYRPPEAMSPYMNLYNRAGVTGMDNYNALVKPALEQQQRDVQTQRDLYRLQQASQFQGSNLQQLNQRTNPYQRGLGAQQGNAAARPPATFMNLQQYYPGFKRQ